MAGQIERPFRRIQDQIQPPPTVPKVRAAAMREEEATEQEPVMMHSEEEAVQNRGLSQPRRTAVFVRVERPPENILEQAIGKRDAQGGQPEMAIR